MKGIFNRWMAWLLAVMMLCALVPFQAIAEESYDAVDPEYWEYIRGVLAPSASNESPATEGVYAILYADGELVFQADDTPAAGRNFTAVYSVNMSGYASAEEIPWYAKRNSIKTANIASKIAPESVAFWFMNCARMEAFEGVENLKMHRVTTMRDMFHGCASLKSLNLDVNASDRWMTVKVTDMSGLFSGCAALTELNLSVLKTPVLEKLEDAFAGCTGLKKLSLVRWDVSSVTSLRGLLRGCSQLTEVDLTGWDTSSVTDMSEMFLQCGKLAAIKASGSFTTGGVTSSDDMFMGCRALKGGSGTIYDPSITDKAYARLDTGTEPGYFSAGVFAILYADGTLAFQYGETPKAGRAVKATFPVEMFDRYVFENQTVNAPWLADAEPDYYRSSIQKVEFVDSISPQKPRYWFFDCSNLEEVLHSENLDLSRATEINDMFYGCKSLRKLDVSSWDTSNISECHAVFDECESLTELDVSGWDTSNMTNMSGLFFGCKNLTKLDVSGFDTGRVTTFSSMFRDCAKLTELDVSNWNTSSAQQMGAMFEGCTGLTELDLSSWDTAKCFYYSEMFMGDTNLKTIWASDTFVLNHDGVGENYPKRGVDVFTGCTALTGGNGMTYDPSCTDYTFLRFDTADAPGYFTNKQRTLRLSNKLPLTQADVPVGLSALGGLTALKLKLDCTDPESTDVIFVAAFYDGDGNMLRAFLAKNTVRPGTATVTIPASGISGAASKLQLFALSTKFVPLAESRVFRLE